MRRVIYGFVIAFLLLTACSQVASPATETRVPTYITKTPSLTPTSTPRNAFPTATRFLTRTPTLSPTFTPTHTLTPTITQIPSATPIGYYVGASPSREWVAWQVDCDYWDVYGCLVFTNEDGERISFPDKDFDLWEDFYDVEIKLAHWAADEEAVYLSVFLMDLHIHFSTVFGVLKLSLLDDSLSWVVAPSKGGNPWNPYKFYRYGFSNNSQWFVYGWQEDETLEWRVKNLDTGYEREFSMEIASNSAFGDITWSPDDQYFVFSISEKTYIDFSDDFSVFLCSEKGKVIKRIYAHGDMFLYFPEWISDTEVKYNYMDLDTHSGEVVLDIETGEMTILN